MTKTTKTPSPRLLVAAAVVLLLPIMAVCAQTLQPTPSQAPPAPTAKADESTPLPDRAQAYFHAALAKVYEEQAITEGRPEYASFAIEEYKKALNADPASPRLNNELAELYFRIGRSHDAESAARLLLKSSPNDLEAHKLLGRIYLRSLSEGQNAPSSASPAGNVLDQAITEYEKIVALEPRNVEERMVLGQLYVVRHDQKKAQEQFKAAQAIEPYAEEVVLNLARMFAESGDISLAAKEIEAVPLTGRTARMEAALGGIYDQLKQTKDAVAAYQRACDMEPGDMRMTAALAQALFNDGQFDAALKQYKDLADADPEDVGNLIHIGEIQRRQGKYEDALTTIRKARKKDSTSLEAGLDEGMLLDVLGHYEEAAQVFETMVDQTSHANGAYTVEEKNNRAIFLERLGGVYQEQNKVEQAIAVYQKLIDMGGDLALSGYRGQVGAYSGAKMYDRSVEMARKAVEIAPKDMDLKLILADQLVDAGKSEEGLAAAKGLIDKSDDHRAAWVGMGQVCIRLRRWKDAEDALNKAEGLTTKKEDRIYLLFLRGELAERQKHYEPAEHFFRQALELDPTSAMTLNYLGYMLADKNLKLPEALKLIRKAVDLEPGNGAFLDSLGWAYFKLGDYELAEQNLRQAVERDQTDPTVHDHMGDLYEKTGRIRQATVQWELSLAEYAKSSAADVEPGDVAKVQRKLENARGKLAKHENATGQPIAKP